MKLLDLQQGTGDWLRHRAACLNASDAPAMMGVSPYRTRADLIRQKATGIEPEYDPSTLARFRAGHDAEAVIRPHAESLIGEELYPVVGEQVFDGLRLSASFDGLTLSGDIGFEHKIWNEALVASVREGTVPESHIWQVVHQHAVGGLDKTLFVVSDGTPEKCVWCWVTVTPEQISRLLDSWRQFAADVAAYQPDQVAQEPTGRAPETLPALHVEVTGMVTSSNLSAFKETALAVFRAINTDLQTDADFADAEKTVKWCKDVEDRLEQTKQHALSQTASIDELFRTMDSIKEEARTVRLKLDKLVKGEKENRKVEIIMSARRAIEEHVTALNQRIGGAWMPAASGAAFAEAVKGLKSLDSMRDKVGAALANSKIEANAMADRIQANKESAADCMHLFPDFGQVCTSPDFRHIVASRKAESERRESERLEAERARIRQEREEEHARIDAAQKDAIRVALATQREEQEAAKSRVSEVHKAIINKTAPAPDTDTGATMKLGEICYRLGFAITAQFLASIGFEPVGHERASKLYRSCDYRAICIALVKHINSTFQPTNKE